MARGYFLISFFIFFLSCTSPEKTESVSIQWQNNKATGLIIPATLLENKNNIEDRLTIHLSHTDSPVLGEIKMLDEQFIFEPVVPFTRELQYEIRFDNIVIAEVQIPKSDAAAPELISIYPTHDTVPENLLKMYFQFSQPMVEDQSLSFIHVLDEHDDTLSGTFLDLKPELWNTDGTVLTLWLDPGRIKRDLIPNKEKGNPLKSGRRYKLVVSSTWKSKAGITLQTSVTKTFVAGNRDEQSPQPELWNIFAPTAGTTGPLRITLQEPLDYSLLMEAIQVVDDHQNTMEGIITLSDHEQTFLFTPAAAWRSGEYRLVVEPRLEDLAGNNLNRLFDQDVTQSKKVEQKIFKRSFTIQ